MTEFKTQIIEALCKVPQFFGVENVTSITRLGGLTNLVHRVELPDASVVVRIAGDGTEEYIDRTVEAVNAVAAARAGCYMWQPTQA